MGYKAIGKDWSSWSNWLIIDIIIAFIQIMAEINMSFHCFLFKGAGKTSITLAVARIIDIENGNLFIEG